MYDPRMKKLAELLIDHSTRLKNGEKVYIEAFDIPNEMVELLVDKVYEKEATPIVSLKSAKVLRKIFKGCDEPTMETIGALEMEKIKKADAYIGLRGSFNITEHSDVPSEKMELYKKHWYTMSLQEAFKMFIEMRMLWARKEILGDAVAAAGSPLVMSSSACFPSFRPQISLAGTPAARARATNTVLMSAHLPPFSASVLSTIPRPHPRMFGSR